MISAQKEIKKRSARDCAAVCGCPLYFTFMSPEAAWKSLSQLRREEIRADKSSVSPMILYYGGSSMAIATR